MALEYRIDTDKRVVYAKGIGEVTAADIDRHEQALATDPDYRPPMTRIVDYRHLERHNISSAELQSISHRRAHQLETFGREHLIFIVASDLVHARVRQTQAYLGESGMRVDLAWSLDEALAQAGLTAEDLLHVWEDF
ncbi:MAG TPA: hypothetical protein VLA56_21030 [Pseudomonadales bacterium]|nr:hypothetical protein [Pseudomonadales bacterium]